MSSTKRNTLIFLSIGGLLTVLLAMSLSHVALLPGQPVSFGRAAAGALSGGGDAAATDLTLLIVRGFMALAIITLPICIAYSLITPQGRQRLLVWVVLLVILLFVANYLHEHSPADQNAQQANLIAGVPPNLNQGADAGSLPTFPAEPPPWLTLAIILAVSLVAVLALVAAVLYWRRREQPDDSAMDRLADEAQNAMASLHAGDDFAVTIIHCYQEMNRVVKEEKGISRDDAMTPREFEDRLVSRGLPREAVASLTRLFEKARYGGAQANTPDEALALACLTDIATACKATRRPAGQHA